VKDQLGNTISLAYTPKRIVSLVPSQTELLFDLGLNEEVKGLTKFCVHPQEKVKSKIIVGGTKKFRFDVIDKIAPDLIIGNKEENYQEGIEILSQKYPVWISDINTMTDAIDMIESLSKITDNETVGKKIIQKINYEFENLRKVSSLSVLYFIWRKPYMVAGQHTFINHMLEKIGLKNAVNEKRYPELSTNHIEQLNPNLILLSSEPYPFKAKYFKDFQNLCPHAEIRIVDGEMFSWYGSRLTKAPDYFNSLNL